MTPEARKRMSELCDKIQTEQDHVKFTDLVRELNRILDEADNLLKYPPDKFTTAVPSIPYSVVFQR